MPPPTSASSSASSSRLSSTFLSSTAASMAFISTLVNSMVSSSQVSELVLGKMDVADAAADQRKFERFQLAALFHFLVFHGGLNGFHLDFGEFHGFFLSGLGVGLRQNGRRRCHRRPAQVRA